MRPDPPLYVGHTRPSSIGWTRIAITVLSGVVLVVLMHQRAGMPGAVVLAGLFAVLTLWTWMGQWTRFIVDEHGLTVSLGGFLPRRAWPLEDFRTVQLRTIPRSRAGVTLGGFGWRRSTVMAASPEELTPVGKRKIYTLSDLRAPYRVLATGPGEMVEIIGKGSRHYLISPVDPRATAKAVDQAIRARR